MSQQSFHHFRARRPQANRGMTLQSLLDRTHGMYRRQGLACVRRNERVWVYTSPQHAAKLPPMARATTDDGQRKLVMRRSDVDYRGTIGGGRAVAFDAKETSGKSIPLSDDKIDTHQVETLCEDERAGALAGFMVHFTGDGRVFFAGASKVRDAKDRAALQPKGKGKYPKSLSLEWMEEHATLVCVVKPFDNLVDWLPVLAKG
jgi:penicillin-binding protein-related factor A (putative recombinase)